MRALHVVATGSRRGAEVFASDLVKALNQRDVAQRVAVLRSSEEGGVFYDAPVRVLGNGNRSVPGLHVDTGALRRLRRIVESWRPDVVQAHGGEAFKNILLATIGQQVRLIYRRIGEAPPWISRVPMRHVYATLMRRASRVVAVADAIRVETVQRFHVPAARVVTIPNGIDVSRLAQVAGRDNWRAAMGIPRDALISATLGALVLEKDPLAHLDVASRVLHQIPTAMHLFVGDGRMRPTLEAAIHDRGVERRTLVLGSRTDIGDVLGAVDVLVFASRPGGMEGMPASVIEAGMMAVPVVASAIVGVPEIVLHGDTGLLVPPGDAPGLARGVIELLRDERTRIRMGEAARRHCLSRFDIGIVADRYLDVYDGLVNDTRR